MDLTQNALLMMVEMNPEIMHPNETTGPGRKIQMTSPQLFWVVFVFPDPKREERQWLGNWAFVPGYRAEQGGG